MTEQRNVMAREKRPFRAMGADFQMEFIPAQHFHLILAEVLDLVVKYQGAQESESPETRKGSKRFLLRLFGCRKNVLFKNIYELMADVIQYQNPTAAVNMDILKKKVSAGEMATFAAMVVNDDEVLDGIQEFIDGLGKTMAKVPEKLQVTLIEHDKPITNSELYCYFASEFRFDREHVNKRLSAEMIRAYIEGKRFTSRAHAFQCKAGRNVRKLSASMKSRTLRPNNQPHSERS